MRWDRNEWVGVVAILAGSSPNADFSRAQFCYRTSIHPLIYPPNHLSIHPSPIHYLRGPWLELGLLRPLRLARALLEPT